MNRHFEKVLDVYENILSHDWLSGAVDVNGRPLHRKKRPTDKKGRAKPRTQHELQSNWREARRILQWAGGIRADLRAYKCLGYVEYVGLALKEAHNLPNFATEVLSRLKRLEDHNEINHVINECAIASSLARSGLSVEFVPKTATRTPDLKIVEGGRTIEVECKLRKPLTPTLINDGNNREMYEQIYNILTQLPDDIRIIATVIGSLDENKIKNVVGRISQRAAEHFRGDQLEPDIEMWLSIADQPIQAPCTVGQFEAARKLFPGSFAVKLGEQGIERISSHVLVNIDGDGYKKINRVLGELNGQIDDNTSAIAYIGVNPVGLWSPHPTANFNRRFEELGHDEQFRCMQIYMKIIASVLQRRVWGGGQQFTKIGAIVLRSGPIRRDVTEDGWTYRSQCYVSVFINPPGWRGLDEPEPNKTVEKISKKMIAQFERLPSNQLRMT